MFYQGSLQDGIVLAVREAKAVVCFVREDNETCLQWEKEYFGDDEFAQSLEEKAVILRLTAGSQEAGFLTSFCPISKFPTVVIIKNGFSRDYLVPEISKDDFRRRLMAAINDSEPPGQSPGQSNLTPQAQEGARTSVTERPAQPPPAAATEPTAPASLPQTPGGRDSSRPQGSSEQQQEKNTQAKKPPVGSAEEPKRDSTQAKLTTAEKIEQQKEERVKNLNRARQEKAKATQKQKATSAARDTAMSGGDTKEASQAQQKTAPSPPKQYRLQVRLFDGSSVRSSFAPSQTIRKDVRSWLDGQLVDETRPYNLKHILTPLPNHTLSIAEEDKTLEELGLGSSATLVMIPVQSYAEAYMPSASSLPVRAVSSVFDLGYSAASLVGSLVGSFLGYDQTPTPTEDRPSSPASSPDGAQRPRPVVNRGPVIRTLGDQRDGRDDTQFYNGNQLNFEPRRDSDNGSS